jgi:hypothetical protein
MVKRAIAILFCFLLFANIAAADTEKLKIIKSDSDFSKPIDATKPIISLIQAKNNTNAYTNTSQPEQIEVKKDSVTSNSVGSGMVSDGINLFGRSLIDGMYKSFDNNSDINNKFGSVRGSLYTVITYVPNPYDDPTIQNLFKNYNALAIFFVIIFIFGEWAIRRLASMKVTSSVFGDKDLSTSRF